MNLKLAILTSTLSLLAIPYGFAQEKSPPPSEASKPASTKASDAEKPTAAEAEAKFKQLLSNATLSGRWAPLKDGELGEEKTGDKYNIASVNKTSGDNWIVSAKMTYHNQDIVLPIPVQVKFIGEAALMIVDKLGIPNGGTYSARLLFYDGTYSGTWSGPRGGGMLYGVVHNEKAGNAQK